MRRVFAAAMATTLAVAVVAGPAAALQYRVGVNVAEFTSDTERNLNGGILPIGGSGIGNGEFTRTKQKGVQLALRISERGVGPVTPTVKDKTIGIYKVPAGSVDGGKATWNYEFNVDLRGAKDKYKNKTLADYKLVLRSEIGGTFFGCDYPCDLSLIKPRNTRLLQQSENPTFGDNDGFNPDKERTYRFQLSLVPKTFSAKTLKVVIKAKVVAP